MGARVAGRGAMIVTDAATSTHIVATRVWVDLVVVEDVGRGGRHGWQGWLARGEEEGTWQWSRTSGRVLLTFRLVEQGEEHEEVKGSERGGDPDPSLGGIMGIILVSHWVTSRGDAFKCHFHVVVCLLHG